MGFFQTLFVIQFVKSSRKGICGLKVIIQNLSWKLCFVKPEEREYVSQEILIITKNYCWLFLCLVSDVLATVEILDPLSNKWVEGK